MSRGLGKPDLPWLAQYCALALGVLLQPYFQSYQTTGEWNWGGLWPRVLFSLITGLVILPAAYRRSFDPGTPGFIQLCMIFLSGMGWQSLLPTTLKIVQ